LIAVPVEHVGRKESIAGGSKSSYRPEQADQDWELPEFYWTPLALPQKADIDQTT
jgi:hypothetical protein